MTKSKAAAIGALVVTGILQFGCPEEMVGAPCVPETDNGDFSATLANEKWSIETRSVQCETRVCLTTWQENQEVSATAADECINNPSQATCADGEDGPVQTKYSFCSCRCQDSAGHTLNSNPDKYDYLCECPPDTKCVSVLKDIQNAPEMIIGSYCVPSCIADSKTECTANMDHDGVNYACRPSSDSEKPWQWKCEEIESE